jgi:hypothetical protein
LGSGADRAIRLHDLRVDMHGSAVHEMRRLFEVHRVHGAYAESRDLRPAETPSMVVFEAEALRLAIGRDKRVRVVELEAALPTFDLVLVWHERVHTLPAQRWLRELLVAVSQEVYLPATSG